MFKTAGRAPGRPEVDNHDLPAQVAQCNRFTLKAGDGEVRRHTSIDLTTVHLYQSPPQLGQQAKHKPENDQLA